MINDDELQVLSFYRASELAGAMLLGSLAQQTGNDQLRAPLTEQMAEEARHAWIFTDLIVQLGATPLRVTRTYQSEVGKVFGMPQNMLDVLCLTQVLEVEVLEHYVRHASMPDLNPAVRSALETVIADEEGHVGWIAAELDEYSSRHGREKVDDAMARAATARDRVFEELFSTEQARRYFKDLPR